ncbi:MAG: DUF4160 domain-containing protein [Parachlamydiaceae bacterium]|nr:DUF4160 domain-containing protein [Parachlamydiaceae bacterium]
MPTIFVFEGYRFFFYSNEGNPREPCHIHIRKGEALAKFWLSPKIALAESYAMSPKELTRLFKIVEENRKLLEDGWNEFFSA